MLSKYRNTLAKSKTALELKFKFTAKKRGRRVSIKEIQNPEVKREDLEF